MKKLLGIVVLILFLGSNTFSEEISGLCKSYGVGCSASDWKKIQEQNELDSLRRENDELKRQVEQQRQLQEMCKQDPRYVGC